MKKLIVPAIVFFLLQSLPAQTFQLFLIRVNAAPDSLKLAIVDSFMNAVPSFPYLEQDTLAYFLFRGNANQITVPGDANGWNQNAFPMQLVSGTNLWYRTEVFEADARLDYKFVLNGTTWILDPLNPRTVSGGYGPNSELCMPDYLPAPEIEYYPNIDHGTIEDTMFYSINLSNTRQIRVYLPPQYTITGDSFPVILFHDGSDYLTLGSARNVIDYLISEHRIEPIIALFVPPVDRNQEYAGSLKTPFTNFIVQEVFPWLDGKYRTRTYQASRAIIGASNGGNISLWLGLQHPDFFGNIGAQSSNVQDTIANGFRNGPFLNLKFYLDIGTYDISALIPLVENFQQILQNRGYPCQYQVYHEGHSWGNWRAHIDNALEMFFPGSATGIFQVQHIPDKFTIAQNFPNPFNTTSVLSIQLHKPEELDLKIYNVEGQLVREYNIGYSSLGKHFIIWNGKNNRGQQVPTGMYFARWKIGVNHSAVIKMFLLK
jgi:enterochelin esterase-like enzyme